MNVVVPKILPDIFFDRGGIVGKIMKEKNWAPTQFGNTENWPQNLSNFTGTILLAHQPMVLYWGPQFLCFFNDAFANTFLGGTELEQKLGQPAFEVIGDIWPDINTRLSRVYKDKVTGTTENILLKTHGTISNRDFHCNITKNLIYNSDASPAAVLAIYTVSNVDEILNTAEQLVLEKDEKLNLVLEATELGTWEWVVNSDEFVCSPQFLKLYGFSANDKLTRANFLSRFYADDIGIRNSAMEQAKKTGVLNYQSRILSSTGEIKWIEISGKFYKGETSLTDRAVGTVRDITAEKESQILLEINEKKFRDLSETAPVLIWMLDPEMKIEFVNNAWRDFTGSHSGEQIDKNWLNSVYYEDFDLIHERIKASRNIKEDFTIEARMKRKDGTYRWMQISGRPRYTAEDTFEGFIGACMDVHDRIIFEQKLKETEFNYRFLADSLPHFIWTTTANGEPQYYNKAFYDFTGFTLEKIRKDGWLEIVHPDDRQENIDRWVKSIEKGEPFIMEHRFKQQDGTYRWQLTRSLPQKDEQGNITIWIGTSMDIEYIKKHDQEKNDFIKMANHELKTPVTTIKGYVQMMKRTHGNTEDVLLNQSLVTIERQVNKLTGLIGNLLDITRIESGHIPLKKELFILSLLVRDTIEDTQAALPSHTLKIIKENNAMVLADKERISQVLVNLFTNAIKYSPQAKEVEISILEKNGEVIVKVEDFGIGISSNDQPQIFERFYRVEGKDEKTYPGFGIGLYIVNEIIQLHEGRLWLESEKDHGSRFYFSLPRKTYISKQEK